MSVVCPQYRTGFYAPKRGGVPKYPSLWRGCVGAWAPCLGPTGLTLRDWSGFRNHGTLTNMDAGSDWVVRQGRYSLDFDGSNDKLQTAAPILSGTGDFEITSWVYPTSFAKAGHIGGNYGVGNSAGVQLIYAQTSGRLAIYCASGATLIGTAALTLNVWNFIIGRRQNGIVEVIVNGVSGGTATRAGSIGTARNWSIGQGTDYTGEEFTGMLAEQNVFSRSLGANERALLASRPGIAYELAPRRRSRIFTGGFKAYWVARKAQIIGGGL